MKTDVTWNADDKSLDESRNGATTGGLPQISVIAEIPSTYSGFQMIDVQESIKNVVAIHELPLHFLCHTQLKSAITKDPPQSPFTRAGLFQERIRESLNE